MPRTNAPHTRPVAAGRDTGGRPAGATRRGLAVATALPALLAAACGAAAPRTADGPIAGATAAPATVRFLLWPSTSPAEQDQIKRLAAGLQRTQPNLTVELTMGAASFDDQLLAMFSGGTPPDTWQASSDNYKG